MASVSNSIYMMLLYCIVIFLVVITPADEKSYQVKTDFDTWAKIDFRGLATIPF